ncbi:MAG: galactokinase [Chthoniobacterales bacterium]|nr:galactokinase [Chthoniobacterales bacterium]
MSSVLACAPGRVELLGNHTDYNQGVALGAAIDRGVTVAGQKRADGIIRLKSAEGSFEIRRDAIEPQKEQRWVNYALGVVQEYIRAGYELDGFEASVSGNLPIGAGLSSSAAFAVATAYFLLRLTGSAMDPLALARMCQKAENAFVGVRSGLLDQATSVFGRAEHLVYLDFQTEEVQTLAFRAGFALVIANSGNKHSLIAGEYNRRREECSSAATALGANSLHDISPAALDAARGEMDPVLYRRACHIVGENDRVWRAVCAMRRDDLAEVGKLMNASHESSRMNFENSTPELDALVQTAQSLSGVLGSRLTGGGFGGSTVTLVAAERAENIAAEMNEKYMARSGHPANAFVCRIADGAAICNRR